MTTVTITPVVMTTADGESRPAKMWGQDSWSCAFCDSPVFGPADWEQHEDDNASHYAKRGETYTAEPYAYRAKYWEARECANPGCITWLNGEALARVREDQARRAERERIEQDRKDAEQAKRDAEAARVARAGELHDAVRFTGEQLGFAWCCTHTERPASYGAEPVMCEASGWDRGEFTAHMRGHGARPWTASVKPIRLRKTPPKAKLPALEVNPFKWAHWAQEHTPEATCQGCGHTLNQHRFANNTISGNVYDCRECACEHRYHGDFTQHETLKADRRGQYLGNGPQPHSVWVIPFEPAPWEDGHAEPVLLHVGKAGRYFTDSWSAKRDRR